MTLCRKRYNVFLRCLGQNDGDKTACVKEDYLSKASCPVAWLDTWREQREEGTFPGFDAPLEELDDDDDDE